MKKNTFSIDSYMLTQPQEQNRDFLALVVMIIMLMETCHKTFSFLVMTNSFLVLLEQNKLKLL